MGALVWREFVVFVRGEDMVGDDDFHEDAPQTQTITIARAFSDIVCALVEKYPILAQCALKKEKERECPFFRVEVKEEEYYENELDAEELPVVLQPGQHDSFHYLFPLHRASKVLRPTCRCCQENIDWNLPHLVKVLVDACPQAAETPDQNGNLPLHLALRSWDSSQAILFLLETFPKAAMHVNKAGNLPIHEFMKRGLRTKRFDGTWHAPLPDETAEFTRTILDALYQVYPESVHETGMGAQHDHETLLGMATTDAKIDWILQKAPNLSKIPNSNRDYPLHSVVKKVASGYNCVISNGTIMRVVNAFPEALKLCNKDKGWTPLFLICDIPDDGPRNHNYNPHLLLAEFLDKCAETASTRDPKGRVPMHVAIKSSIPFLFALDALYEYFPGCLTAQDSHGNTPMHLVCNGKNAEWCIQKNPRGCNIANNDNMYPLHRLVKRPQFVCYTVKLAIDANVQALRCADKDGNLPLHLFFKSRRIHFDQDIFRCLIEQYPQSALHANQEGKLPIHTFMEDCSAAQSTKDIDIIERLLSEMSTLSPCPSEALPFKSVDSEGNNILHLANRPEKTLWVLKRYPELCELRNNNGDFPIHSLMRKYEQWASPCSYSFTAIEEMIRINYLAIRKTNNEGKLPIHLAASCGNKRVLRKLVEGYPDGVKCVDDLGRLPIHWYFMRNCGYSDGVKDCLTVLHEANPKGITCCDHFGNLPLHLAKDHKVVAFALETYDDACHVRNQRGEYPIHLLPTVCYLSLYGTKMSGPNESYLLQVEYLHGNLPVHVAIQNGSPARHVKALLGSPDNWPKVLMRRNNDGRLPLHLVCGRKNGNDKKDAELIETMIAAYPKSLASFDNDGFLPIHHFFLRKPGRNKDSMFLKRLMVVETQKACGCTYAFPSTRDGTPLVLLVAETYDLSSIYDLLQQSLDIFPLQPKSLKRRLSSQDVILAKSLKR